MSPLLRPLGFGAPWPLRRWMEPCLVPGPTLIFFVPSSVGTSIVAPRSASAIVIGTVTSRLPPSSRLKNGEAAAGRPAALSGLALASEPDSRSVLDPGRDVDLVALGLLGQAGAVAGGAGVLDDLAGAAALRAGPADRENSLALGVDAAAFAARAGDRAGPRFGAA